MRSISLSRPVRRFGVLAALSLALASCGGEIVGIGNSSNVIAADVLDRVAQELAGAPAIPAVSDEDLRAAFAAIRERALGGDPEAALVLLRVAAYQREESEDE